MSEESAPKQYVDLSKLETRTSINGLLAPLVLGLNCLGILCCGYVMFSLSSTLHDLSGMDLIDEVKEDYRAFEEVDAQTRKSVDLVPALSTRLDIELSDRSILDATQAMQETEKNAQLFLRLLKVNMYNLTSYIPGIASWYELHSPEIDFAIERSRSRQLKLLEIQTLYAQGA